MISSVSESGPIFDSRRAFIQLATELFVVRPIYKLCKKLEITGQENVPKDIPVIVVSNHRSYWDPPIMSIATRKPICYVAKKELFEHAQLSLLIRLLGAVSIDRQKPSLTSIKQIKRAIKAGWSLGIFIEGTRSKIPGVLGKPQIGPAYFANANKLPILPVGLVDTDRADKRSVARVGRLIAYGPDLEAKTWEIMTALSTLTGYRLPADKELETA